MLVKLCLCETGPGARDSHPVDLACEGPSKDHELQTYPSTSRVTQTIFLPYTQIPASRSLLSLIESGSFAFQFCIYF